MDDNQKFIDQMVEESKKEVSMPERKEMDFDANKNPVQQPTPTKKTVGEDLTKTYSEQFFKESGGDRNKYIEHNITRFGIPRGSTRAKEIEHYGKEFDDISAKQPTQPKPQQPETDL